MASVYGTSGRRVAGLAALALLGGLAVVLSVATPSASAQGSKDPWADAFPKDWSWASKPEQWEKIEALVGRKAPSLSVGSWHNEGGKPLRELRGKPVVIDFWGTWCPPCRAAAPHFTELAEEYEGRAHFLAVCNTRGGEKMISVADEVGMGVPTARDNADQTARAYGVQWWPYYVFIDSEGVVRAAGINSGKVEDALEAMLKVEASLGRGGDADAGDDPHAGGGDFQVKEAWLEDGDRPVKRRRLEELQGGAAPALEVVNWMNSEAMGLEDLKGKIVVVDFWGTWCMPCIKSIPKTNELHAKYKDQGVVIVGVCNERQWEKMPATAEEHKIAYPIAADSTGATAKAYRVNGYPDYYVIDRSGTLVAADVANSKVEDVIQALLEAQPGEGAGDGGEEATGGEGDGRTPAKRVRRPSR